MKEIEENKKALLLARNIMEKAHQNQKRMSGEPYQNHPLRCLENYRKLIGYQDKPTQIISLESEGIPFFGVEEVCLLHDVIEDTPYKMEDLERLFQENGLGDYFRKYIKDALKRITHDKRMDYLPYIEICKENPISAICKMMDLQDNLYVLSLSELNTKNYDRAKRYLTYLYQINEKYHFIEKTQKYREEYYQ